MPASSVYLLCHFATRTDASMDLAPPCMWRRLGADLASSRPARARLPGLCGVCASGSRNCATKREPRHSARTWVAALAVSGEPIGGNVVRPIAVGPLHLAPRALHIGALPRRGVGRPVSLASSSGPSGPPQLVLLDKAAWRACWARIRNLASGISGIASPSEARNSWRDGSAGTRSRCEWLLSGTFGGNSA